MENFPMPKTPERSDEVYERVKKEMNQIILTNYPELKGKESKIEEIMERDYEENKKTMRKCIETMTEDIDPAKMEHKWAKLFIEKIREEMEQRMAA